MEGWGRTRWSVRSDGGGVKWLPEKRSPLIKRKRVGTGLSPWGPGAPLINIASCRPFTFAARASRPLRPDRVTTCVRVCETLTLPLPLPPPHLTWTPCRYAGSLLRRHFYRRQAGKVRSVDQH